MQIVDELGLKLTQTANTHCHADHITGSGKIKVRRLHHCCACNGGSNTQLTAAKCPNSAGSGGFDKQQRVKAV